MPWDRVTLPKLNTRQSHTRWLIRNQRREKGFILFTPKWSISNFPCSLIRTNITSHSMKNLAFHSLLRQMKDDYTTDSHYFIYTFCFERLGECPPLNLGAEGLSVIYPMQICKRLDGTCMKDGWMDAWMTGWVHSSRAKWMNGQIGLQTHNDKCSSRCLLHWTSYLSIWVAPLSRDTPPTCYTTRRCTARSHVPGCPRVSRDSPWSGAGGGRVWSCRSARTAVSPGGSWCCSTAGSRRIAPCSLQRRAIGALRSRGQRVGGWENDWFSHGTESRRRRLSQ